VSDSGVIPDKNHAAPFRAQADRIDLNRGPNFAGAFVIVDPDGNIEATLLLDDKADPAIFWSIIQTKAQIAVARAEEEQRNGQGGFGAFGGRR
jgi:hypothetical protein